MQLNAFKEPEKVYATRREEGSTQVSLGICARYFSLLTSQDYNEWGLEREIAILGRTRSGLGTNTSEWL